MKKIREKLNEKIDSLANMFSAFVGFEPEKYYENENLEKMEKLPSLPESLVSNSSILEKKEKLPELTIHCPACNDREHKTTIIATELVPGEDDQGLILECDNCKARFSLPRCRLIMS